MPCLSHAFHHNFVLEGFISHSTILSKACWSWWLLLLLLLFLVAVVVIDVGVDVDCGGYGGVQ